ncbi:MAG: hypothetical protein OEZ37_09130 [Gemmatimonadota bacterium]|nr:hypothetical protein [Gemmatimonadota bacterium]
MAPIDCSRICALIRDGPGWIAAIVVCLGTSGCTAWYPVTVPPRELIESHHPSRVRVVGPDGVRIIVRDPEVVNDSIVGTREGVCDWDSHAGAGPVCMRAFPVVRESFEVESLEVQRTSMFRTAAVIVGANVVLMLAWTLSGATGT